MSLQKPLSALIESEFTTYGALLRKERKNWNGQSNAKHARMDEEERRGRGTVSADSRSLQL